VECPDDTAQITAADEGSMADIIAQMRSEINDVKKMCQSRIVELENKCQSLETKCSSLERSIGILTKESIWEYSVSDIHRGYWIDKGYSDDYADDMEELIEDMKSLTHALRRGQCNHISLGGHENGLLLDNDDDVLLPHWEELANALQLYQSTDVSKVFSIDAIQLTPSIMDLLEPALVGKLIECISFDNNELDDNVREGIEFAVKSIKSIRGLSEFNWSSNHISSQRDAQYLVDSVISHPSIDAIQFTDCFSGDVCGYDILCQLLASGNYKQIIFNHNFRGTGGRTEVPDYIATNPPLNKLLLSGNELNDDNIVLIVRSLKHNTNLRHLRLEHNNITEVGKAALIKVVYDTTSLNSMADCNHTCCIDSISYGDMPNPNLSKESPKKRRARKIYHLLSERNKDLSNTQHLNSEFDDEEEDSLKLVPKVLECVHSYSPPPLW